ncbi:hypothetical protein RHMOL_Rhmol02G0197600 [Rhododendron molle]|uniref:Uncharacterized protein n=1 Tax=Rhododendron molle TaxID=49168 RepID=A0ACC0PTD2_RHOML|nr:hypothetical protein RHMOL_Rhmol02G0197600 [Rhododendron molle]
MFSFLRISAHALSFREKSALSIIENIRGIYRAPGPRSGPGWRSYETPTRVPSVPPGLGYTCPSAETFSLDDSNSAALPPS